MKPGSYIPILLKFFEGLPGASGPISLNADTPILEDGILDSLNLFMLVSYIEDEIGIAVDPEDVIPEHFGTLNAINALIQGKAAETVQ